MAGRDRAAGSQAYLKDSSPGIPKQLKCWGMDAFRRSVFPEHWKIPIRTALWATTLALVLRIGALAFNPGLPFWFDEIWTAQFATFSVPIHKVVERLAKEDLHPPLGYLAYYPWAKIWSIRDNGQTPPYPGHEDRMRLLPLLVGALGAGILAVAMLAIGVRPWIAIFISMAAHSTTAALTVGTEVRQYGLLLALLPAILWAAYEKKPKAFIVAGTLAAYTHYFALPLLLALALRPSLRRAGVWVGVLFAPWLPILAVQLTGKSLRDAQAAVSGVTDSFVSNMIALGGNTILGAALLILSLIGWGLWAKAKKEEALAFLGFAGLIALAGAVGIPVWNWRYIAVYLPLLAIGWALLLEKAASGPKAMQGMLIFLLTISAISGFNHSLGQRNFAVGIGLIAKDLPAYPPYPILCPNRAAAYTVRYYDRKHEIQNIPKEAPQFPAFVIGPAGVQERVKNYPTWTHRLRAVRTEGYWALYLWKGSEGKSQTGTSEVLDMGINAGIYSTQVRSFQGKDQFPGHRLRGVRPS